MADPLDFDVLLAARARLVVDGILAALEAEDISKPVRIVYLVPGEAVVDDFEDANGVVSDSVCGQLTARLASLTPHVSGNRRSAAGLDCEIDYYTATLEIILTRCAATVNNQGGAPSPEALLADALEGAQDLRIILSVLRAFSFSRGRPTWTPRGPMGGRHGNRVTFDILLDPPPAFVLPEELAALDPQ